MSWFNMGRVTSEGTIPHRHQNAADGAGDLRPSILQIAGLLSASGTTFSLFGDIAQSIGSGSVAGFDGLSAVTFALANTGSFRLGAVGSARSTTVNNFNPGGAAGTKWVCAYLTANATFSVTGLDSTFGVNDGTIVILTKTGTGATTFNTANASSTAANRFSIGGDVSISSGQSAAFIYDTSASRWRLLWAPAQTSRVVLAVALGAAVNDWAPSTPLPDVLEVTTGLASRTITGIVAGTDGQAMDVTCSDGGASALVLVHNSASSAVANRFLLSGSNRTITVGTRLIYDGSIGAWKALGGF